MDINLEFIIREKIVHLFVHSFQPIFVLSTYYVSGSVRPGMQ